MVVIVPVIALIILIGVAPGLFLNKSRVTVNKYVETYQTRIMKKRNEATATRNDKAMKLLIRQQMQQQIQKQMGGAINLNDVQWEVGPHKKGGE